MTQFRYAVLLFLFSFGVFLWADSVETSNVSAVESAPIPFFQKGKLNDPIMTFDMDPLETKLEQHIYQIREGSPVGYDASGGSCGCN